MLGGGLDKIQKQIASGKKTARQRLELILDEESFEEIDLLGTSHFLDKKFYTDGVITGFGKINGREVAIFSQDFTVKGGSLGARHAQKIGKIMDTASKIGCPIIGILDSGGARIDEGIHSLAGYGDIFMRNTRYSGIIPQISLVLGPCAGGAVYSPALTDFIFTTDKISQLFITGPDIVKQVLHQDITKEELGGASVHASKSGLAHFVTETEEECFEKLKLLLSYIPNNYLSLPPAQENANPAPINLQELVLSNSNKAYDVKNVINSLVDEESFFELQELFAPNIVVGFARIEGNSVGIVANQPLVKAGVLDIDSSCKAARFINTCNNFNIPIVSLVDVPGFLPGIDQEHSGIIRHGAKLIYAYANATVPKITIIMRKAFGGAYIVMGSKHLGADFIYAWPKAQIAVLGADGAINILHRRELNQINSSEEKEKKYQELKNQYSEKFLNPLIAAEYGYIDGIIDPNETRKHLIRALQITREKVETLSRRKAGNIPL